MTAVHQLDAVPSVLDRHRRRMDVLTDFLLSADRSDSISNYLSSLGDPTKDSGASGRPTLKTRLHPYELEALYLQCDVAGTIVDELVDEALRKGVQVAVDGDGESTDPMAAWTDDLDVVETVGLGAKWGRLYGGGFVMMILDDGLDPSAPVDHTRINSVVQLVDLDRYEATPQRWQNDLTQPNFGEPVLYQITPQTEGGAVGWDKGLVHASRLLRFGGVRLPRTLRAKNFGFDDSILQRPWDAIRRFIESEQAMARIVQSYEVATVTIAGLSSVLQDDEGARLIQQRIALMAQSASLINAILLDADAGEQYQRQASSVSGLAELRDRFAESVSKAARMPQTILFGTAPSGLNTDGESGIQAWHKRVSAYQTHVLRKELEKLYKCIWWAKDGPTGGTEPENWSLVWPALDEPGEHEQAETRHIVAQTDALYIDRGVRSPDQVSRSRDGAAGWSMETVAPDDDDLVEPL